MPFDAKTTLSFDEAYEIIGGLSDPSKMPWKAWSISAKLCKTGGKLRKVKGSVCEKCYAHKGFYPMPNVQNAMERRLKGLDHPLFVDAFVTVLEHLYKGEDRFRWHDSGDVLNEDHLRKIVNIARRLPYIRFYLPTKETGLVGKFGAFPPNLFVKISHPLVGETFGDRSPKGLSYTTCGRDDDETMFQCPAKKHQGNKCLDCDKCWTSANINYPIH